MPSSKKTAEVAPQEPVRFKLQGPLSGKPTKKELALFEEETYVLHQYAGNRRAADDGEVRCYHVIDEATNEIAGVLTLRHGLEDLKPVFNAFVHIEFVALRQKYRGRGASKQLRDFAYVYAKKWLTDCLAKIRDGDKLVVQSSSNVATDQGEIFVRKLNIQLRRFCKRHHLKLLTSVEKD